VKRKGTRGFTLVELMVVVIILGILAAVVIPQFANNTDDARVATLDANLTEMRNAIELYYHQHNGTYPGAVSSSDGKTASATPDDDFKKQMTLFTAITGQTSPTKDDTFRFGPYLRKSDLPVNPFTNDNVLTADATTTSLSTNIHTPGTPSAWRFAVQIGKFIANDSADNAQR
jgi:general secretion pathway protein G